MNLFNKSYLRATCVLAVLCCTKLYGQSLQISAQIRAPGNTRFNTIVAIEKALRRAGPFASIDHVIEEASGPRVVIRLNSDTKLLDNGEKAAPQRENWFEDWEAPLHQIERSGLAKLEESIKAAGATRLDFETIPTIPWRPFFPETLKELRAKKKPVILFVDYRSSLDPSERAEMKLLRDPKVVSALKGSGAVPLLWKPSDDSLNEMEDFTKAYSAAADGLLYFGTSEVAPWRVTGETAAELIDSLKVGASLKSKTSN